VVLSSLAPEHHVPQTDLLARFSSMPKPRPVRLRRSARLFVWSSRAVTVPFFVAVLFFVHEVLKDSLILAFGTDGTATVTHVQAAWRRRKPIRGVFNVTYEYDLGNGMKRLGYGSVDSRLDSVPDVGNSVAIRRVSIGPYQRAVLRDGYRGTITGWACISLFAIVWCGFIIAAGLFAWLGPMFERRLIQDGAVAPGRYTRAKQLRGGHYSIEYFYDSSDGARHSGDTIAGREVFAQVSASPDVIVFYDPNRPRRSRLYEASRYEVVRD
jgi:hypothetical protein